MEYGWRSTQPNLDNSFKGTKIMSDRADRRRQNLKNVDNSKAGGNVA